jgi:hypothetical protein
MKMGHFNKLLQLKVNDDADAGVLQREQHMSLANQTEWGR